MTPVTYIINKLSGPLYLPSISLFYLLVKIMIRHILKVLLKSHFDLWDTLSWFAVDIALLSLALSISLHVPDKMGFGYEQSVIWYLAFGALFIICCLCYAYTLQQKHAPQPDSCLKIFVRRSLFAGVLSFSWLISLFSLILVVNP